MSFQLAIFRRTGLGARLSGAAEKYASEYIYSPDEGADHEPTEFERLLFEDMLAGLFADEAFAEILQGAARGMKAVEALREALEFYAEPYGKCEQVPDFYSELSFGERAAEALKVLQSAPPAPDAGHHYISTACYHGLHTNCRRTCKFCATDCRCACHTYPLNTPVSAAPDAKQRLESLHDAGRVKKLECDRENATDLMCDLNESDGLDGDLLEIATQWASKIRVEAELAATAQSVPPATDAAAEALNDIANGRLNLTDAMLESKATLHAALVEFSQRRAREALQSPDRPGNRAPTKDVSK